MTDITLSASVRSNLLSLQNTQTLMTGTQGRLSTGLKVSSAIDDAVSYFKAKSLNDRASDLASRKDQIDQGISTLNTALNGLSTVDSALKQIKGALNSYKTADAATQDTLRDQIKGLKEQIDQVVSDSSYQGLNLLKADTSLVVYFNSTNENASLKVSGSPSDAKSLGLYETPESVAGTLSGDAAKLVQSWTGNPSASTAGTQTQTDATQQAAASTTGTNGGSASQGAGAAAGSSSAQGSETVDLNQAIDALMSQVDKAISQVRATSASVGGNVSFLQARLDFTKDYANTLAEGSGKLTLADLNEEGANLVALQTRQQIGVQSLSFAGQQEQAVLQLLR